MLPKEFWEANEFGVKGGIESAFMSTTLNEKVAISYASSGNGTGFVFEIQQGMVDRGAGCAATERGGGREAHRRCEAALGLGSSWPVPVSVDPI